MIMNLRLHRFNQNNDLIMLGVEGSGFEPDLLISIPPGLAMNTDGPPDGSYTLLEGTQGTWRLRPLVNELSHTWSVRGHALITLAYIQTHIWRVIVSISTVCDQGHEETPHVRRLALTFDLPGYNHGWNGDAPQVPPSGTLTEEEHIQILTRFERPWVI
jgi:hypothetical protein